MFLKISNMELQRVAKMSPPEELSIQYAKKRAQ